MIETLSRDNSRLKELEEAYAKLNLFEHSLWKTFADGIDIHNFRGEHAYLSQMWNMTPERYRNTLHYALDKGLRDDIEYLGEDDAFGCITFREDMGANEDDIIYSRDLLDSVFEIQFLRETLALNSEALWSLLDIGAGYGRLLYRYVQYFESATAWGVDGVPLSTFLCDFYTQYRKYWSIHLGDYNWDYGAVYGQDRIITVPLHKLSSVYNIDVASNVYSFSEMPLSAVNFWLDFCADLNIPYFFLVPHAPDLVHAHFLTTEPDGSHQDYMPAFIRHGYQVERQRAKFPFDMSPRLIYNTSYWLFKRGSA